MSELLTIKETAGKLKVSTRTVARLLSRRELLAARVTGRAVRVSERELERFLLRKTK